MTPHADQYAADLRFVIFTACIIAASVGGYLLRRTGLADPRWASRVMSAAIVGCDAPIALLAIWHLQMDPGIWKVPVAGLAGGVATCLAGLAIGRRIMPPPDAALFGLQAGMGNVGYTLGGSLCFVIWGIQGLAIEQMFCLMWPFFAFLFCFPLGRHYGAAGAASNKTVGEAARRPQDTVGPAHSALAALGHSLADIRSLPLYLAVIGLVLNLRGPRPPSIIERSHIIDILMVAGILAQFGGVGLTVQIRQVAVHWRKAIGCAALKFLLSPVIMLVVCLFLGMAGTPLYVNLLLAAMPTAIYSVLMANLFGLNRDLANTTFILTHAICLTAVAAVAALWEPAGFLTQRQSP